MIGRVLANRYSIVAAIGEGGMSCVWRALDLNTGKQVAVKVLREEYREDENFVRRFEREAQAASRMSHPNIANLLDVGVEEDGTRYLVIEYISGKTLKRFIQESGALRPEIAAQIIIRVLAAVQHAHQNGVIHRDIKPQNILIDKEGTIKVSDFGIARIANAQTMNPDADTVMGSVYYFSPEQAKGTAVDEKSDLYSVGAVFYEMLTGQVPFSGETPVAIAMKHLQEVPPAPSTINETVSQAMDFVVLHAMEKRPRNRYLSAADMLRDVRLALEHPEAVLAAHSEAERRKHEARTAQKQRWYAQKRARSVRRVLACIFAVLLLAGSTLAGVIIIRDVMRSRQNTLEVPDVITWIEADAVRTMETLGLQVSVRYDTYPLVPAGVVYDQSIEPGKFVKSGEKITLIVCQSEYDASMPNVVGMMVDKAQETLSGFGLMAWAMKWTVNDAAANEVIAQDPPVGTLMKSGTNVSLTISYGMAVTPDLVGMLQSEAEQRAMAYTLSIGGVEMRPVDDPKQVGRVIAQTPPAFTPTRPGSAMQLEIGTADAALYEGYVTLNLADFARAGTVTIKVINDQGVKETLYSRYFESESADVMVPLYSQTERVAPYTIYFDDEAVSSGTVTFGEAP